MRSKHPLTLGAVVARAQVVLGGVAVDLIVDEEVERAHIYGRGAGTNDGSGT